jgi:hypothetical protein
MSKSIQIDKLVNLDSKLTGKFRFRTNIFGKLILQVEFSVTDHDPHGSSTRSNWRDAQVEDLTLLEPSN